jgi:osmotically-inducible protein OsmY
MAPQTPTDAKVLLDVNDVLENEKAFRGLVIVPRVSHGMVTLAGTVSSEGDKVPAAMEVGQVNGVKTVSQRIV